MKKVSIVIRAHNEEKWIGHCLREIYSQDFTDFEIILVDNNSTDRTLAIASEFPLKKIVNIDNFFPGLAINQGILESNGEFIVLLSAHCIPTTKDWLFKLISNFDDTEVVGVYGRQEPLPFSTDFDKRDLLLTFGLDKKIQRKDSFFHNANSAIRRTILATIPIDNTLTNIEDRVWAKSVIEQGHVLVYEPEASVYHYHGIHQNQDIERCQKIVRILEGLNLVPARSIPTPEETRSSNSPASHPQLPHQLDAIIPLNGKDLAINGKSLLEFTVNSLRESSYTRKIIILTNDLDVVAIAKRLDCLVPFVRKKSKIDPFMDIETVLQQGVAQLEAEGVEITPEVIIAYPTKPFRLKGFYQALRENYLKFTLKNNTLISAVEEHEAIWLKDSDEGELKLVGAGLIPREYKKSTFISQFGLGTMTTRDNLIHKSIFLNPISIYPIKSQICKIEIRTQEDANLYGKLLEEYTK